MCAEFLAAHRGQGMCTAAAALAAQAVQLMGLIPVWSAAYNNHASLRVAQKVGYVEVGYWVYLVKRDALERRIEKC
jgi:RimJ/RimL family protein N-acetyltransferase